MSTGRNHRQRIVQNERLVIAQRPTDRDWAVTGLNALDSRPNGGFGWTIDVKDQAAALE